MTVLRAALALLGVAILGWLATPTTAHALSAPQERVERCGALTADAPALETDVRDACEVEEGRDLLTGTPILAGRRFPQCLAHEVPASEYIDPPSSALRSTSLPARQ